MKQVYQALQKALHIMSLTNFVNEKQKIEKYSNHLSLINDGLNIRDLNPGDWICYYNVIFESNVNFFELHYLDENFMYCDNLLIEVRIDRRDNEPIVTFVPQKTETWKEYVYDSIMFATSQNIQGVHDVYLTFSGDNLLKQNVANIAWFGFKEMILLDVKEIKHGKVLNKDLQVEYGKDFTINFVSNEGYIYDRILIDGEIFNGKVKNNSFTLKKVKKAHEIVIEFKLIDNLMINFANKLMREDVEKFTLIKTIKFKEILQKSSNGLIKSLINKQ